jgi:steroid delta-isomerase-like uncharacterized protein
MDNKQLITNFIDQVLNQGNIDATSRFFAHDVIEQVPFPGQGPGIEGIKLVIRSFRAAFPDMQWSVDEQIAEEDKVVTRFEWTGTHGGEFLGIPATGKQVRIWGVVIDRIENGKVQDTRILMDTLGLMSQLGVFPPQTTP